MGTKKKTYMSHQTLKQSPIKLFGVFTFWYPKHHKASNFNFSFSLNQFSQPPNTELNREMKEIIKKIRKTQYLDSKIIYGFGSVFSHAVRKKRNGFVYRYNPKKKLIRRKIKETKLENFNNCMLVQCQGKT